MIIAGTLSRYFAMRFLGSVIGSLIGVIALAAMIDYVELMRRGADWPNATAWLLAKISMYRVPQLSERIFPFTVLVGAMSCYLTLSRIARAAGLSAWQFVAPVVPWAQSQPLFTTLSRPCCTSAGFWVRQKSNDGAAIINAAISREQGARFGGVSVYTFDINGHFQDRIEAKSAALREGFWQLEEARSYRPGHAPDLEPTYRLPTNLTLEQVRESFATPKPCRFGNCRITSSLLIGPACSRRATGCNISSCWLGRFCSPRWSCWQRR
jgi:lipopolysaccharide export system permease protein